MSTLLESLDPELRDAIMQTGTLVVLRTGESVFKRGDSGEALYVIQEGRVRVHDEDLT